MRVYWIAGPAFGSLFSTWKRDPGVPHLPICTAFLSPVAGLRMSPGAEGAPAWACLHPAPKLPKLQVAHFPSFATEGTGSSSAVLALLDEDSCQKGLGWNEEDDKGRKLGRNEQSESSYFGLRTVEALCKHLFILSITNPFTDYFNQHTNTQ